MTATDLDRTPLLDPSAAADTVAITGHRPDRLDGDYTTSSPLWAWIAGTLTSLYRELSIATVIQGMAAGVDQLAGETALDAGLAVHAAIPFNGQADRWPAVTRRRWRQLAERSTVTVVTPGGYAAWKLHARNQYMIDRAVLLLAVWDGTRSGGTYQTVTYARRRHTPAVIIDPVGRTVSWDPRPAAVPAAVRRRPSPAGHPQLFD